MSTPALMSPSLAVWTEPTSERLRASGQGCRVLQVSEDSGRSRASVAMDRYADGDDSAFAEVYDELAPKMLAFVRSMLGSASSAEDVVQQAFLQLHEARGNFARGAKVEPWAYTIARRVAIDWMRRRTKRSESSLTTDDGPKEPVDDTSPSPEGITESRQLNDALNRELKQVPEGLRAAFVMLRLEGFSAAETGTMLGVSQAAAKVRAHRAGQLLRSKMARFFTEESQ